MWCGSSQPDGLITSCTSLKDLSLNLLSSPFSLCPSNISVSPSFQFSLVKVKVKAVPALEFLSYYPSLCRFWDYPACIFLSSQGAIGHLRRQSIKIQKYTFSILTVIQFIHDVIHLFVIWWQRVGATVFELKYSPFLTLSFFPMCNTRVSFIWTFTSFLPLLLPDASNMILTITLILLHYNTFGESFLKSAQLKTVCCMSVSWKH